LQSPANALENVLNDFNVDTRKAAFIKLLGTAGVQTTLPRGGAQAVNMHCHSFYSYNSYGFSPLGLAWLAKQQGWDAAGIVDFDVLDGVEEFLEGCSLANLRGSAAIETRIYIPEFADRVTNSPGEPGISYHCGIGFTSGSVNPKSARILQNMRRRADQRNRSMVEKLNNYLDPVCLDYDRDVVPLTPAGNVTERHMLAAYIQAAASQPDLAGFWAKKLELDPFKAKNLLADPSGFANTARGRLMKRGGIGYIPPSPEAFPTVEEFHEMVVSCGAIPTINYLDGSTPGERSMEELFTLLTGKGAAALNMIPNLAIPDTNGKPELESLKRERLDLLYRNVSLARQFDLPLHIGTEMNSYGQRFVDDLSSPELAPVKQDFVDGAYFVYGHVRLQQSAGLGYQSEWAKTCLPARADRNAFYTHLGALIPPGEKGSRALKGLSAEMSPAKILNVLSA
jgi:hypothetical protein